MGARSLVKREKAGCGWVEKLHHVYLLKCSSIISRFYIVYGAGVQHQV